MAVDLVARRQNSMERSQLGRRDRSRRRPGQSCEPKGSDGHRRRGSCFCGGDRGCDRRDRQCGHIKCSKQPSKHRTTAKPSSLSIADTQRGRGPASGITGGFAFACRVTVAESFTPANTEGKPGCSSQAASSAAAEHLWRPGQPVGLQLLWRKLHLQHPRDVLQLLRVHRQLPERQWLRHGVQRRDVQSIGWNFGLMLASRRKPAPATQAVSSIQATSAPIPPPVVQTDAGLVTLQELPALSAKLAALKQQVQELLDEARSLRSLAEDRFVDLGSVLLDTPSWMPPADMAQVVNDARSIHSRIVEESSELEALRTEGRHGISGVFGKVGTWNQSRKLEHDRAELQPQLRASLLQIGQKTSDIRFETATNLRHQANAASDQASQLEATSAGIATTASTLEAEIKRRSEAEQEMGFDAPYLAAYLNTYGPQAVESPLNLKRGERALAVVSARLARQQTRTHYVGGSQGLSFPIGHTGIRYRVGSYHGHPVQQQLLATLDSGSLVITDQRIAFIGPTKATSIALSKVVHLQCYADAIAVFQQGRENPDYYLMAQPKYALFMINWAESQAN